VSRLAQDSASAEAAFDCRATAAMLKSMRSLEWASHIGAVLAVGGHKWFPLLVWGVVIYFAVRVRLDAELLEMLAEDPECAPGRLDQWLSQVGLRSSSVERSIKDRCKGARVLARYLVCAVLLQFAVTALVFWGSK